MPKSKEFVASDSGSATESEAEAEAKDSGSDYEPKSKKKDSKNGKKKDRKESESEDSGSGSDYEPKPKRSKKKEEKPPKKSAMGPRPDEKFLGDFSVQLAKMRWLSVSQFKGKPYVNIREFYEAEDGIRPGKKGIALNREQWDKLKEHMGDVDKALKNM